MWLNREKRLHKAYKTMRFPEEIIEMRDGVHRKMIDAERTKDKESYYQYKNQLAILKWVIKENGNPKN